MIAGMSFRTAFARLLFALAALAAIIGIIVAFAGHRAWKLGVLGWLMLAVVGMAAGIAVLADEFVANRNRPATK